MGINYEYFIFLPAAAFAERAGFAERIEQSWLNAWKAEIGKCSVHFKRTLAAVGQWSSGQQMRIKDKWLKMDGSGDQEPAGEVCQGYGAIWTSS